MAAVKTGRSDGGNTSARSLNREEPENPATEENIVEHEIAGIRTEPPTLAEIKTLQEA